MVIVPFHDCDTHTDIVATTDRTFAPTLTVMTRTLLTGGSGFIAAHILNALLKRGHSVVTTVRSQEKAEQIRTLHPGVSKENLDFVIVPDVSAPDGSYLLIYPFLSIFFPRELTVELYMISSLRPGSRF